jgi:four helix bundle protein
MADNFEDLTIWQSAHHLAVEIYRITSTFPTNERRTLVPQIRRSATSVSANIAESHGVYHYAEAIQFIRRARGSLEETRNHLMLARDLQYLPSEKFDQLDARYIELRKMINGYIRSIMNRKVAPTR